MTLPNTLTLLRLGLIPPFYILSSIKGGEMWGAVLFLLAALTDPLDGYFARKLNQVTDVGKILDTLVDKLLLTAGLLILLEGRIVPHWSVLVILSREFIVMGLRALLANRGVIVPAHTMGKYKFTFQMIAVCTFLFFPMALLGNHWLRMGAYGIYYVALVMTVVSGLDYMVKFYKEVEW